MIIKTVDGFVASVGEPRTDHGWNTSNPVVIGHIYKSTKLKSCVSAGVWDSVTGIFLMYPDLMKKEQYKLILNLPTATEA